MPTKALDLFQAYSQSKLPQEGGYIISSFFDRTSPYAIYEVVAYNGVKSIYLSEQGLTFQTDGNKLFVLAEPPSYHEKHVEPFRRDASKQIPHRFSELEIITSKNQTKVMISKDPIATYSSFTVLRPAGMNFAFIFYNLPDVSDTVQLFFEKTLVNESNIPKPDAKKSSAYIVEGLSRFTIWK